MNNLVKIHEFESMELAKAAASNLASDTFGQVCPVITFRQGNRICASTTLPICLAVNILTTNPVDKKGSLDSVKKSYNRPIDKDHVKAVSRYVCNALVNNDKFILPSLTVTAVREQNLFTTKVLNNQFTQLGYLVLSIKDKTLTVTDGQHRLEGIKDALNFLAPEHAEVLEKDGIPIMFSFEDDINQVHQDFADCSKTKSLPKSMIAVYDRRVPANGLLLDAIERCPLFSDGKTDSTSTSLSKKSNCILLNSGIRTLMKALFTGNHSMADSSFDDFANKELSNKESYNKYLDYFTWVINTMTSENEILLEISSMERGPGRQKIVFYREKNIIANMIGLVMACKFIHKISKDVNNKKNDEVRSIIHKLMNDVDWSKDNNIWHGNIIVNKGEKYSITSLNRPVSNAMLEIEKIVL